MWSSITFPRQLFKFICAITHDKIGNALKWRNGMEFTWVNGRQLAMIEKTKTSGEVDIYNYTYNADGIRTSKTVKIGDATPVTTTYH